MPFVGIIMLMIRLNTLRKVKLGKLDVELVSVQKIENESGILHGVTMDVI
jgi:hypothetical protein